MADDPNAPAKPADPNQRARPAGEPQLPPEGEEPGAAPAAEPPAGQLILPQYQNIWLFGGALVVLALLFLFVLMQLPDREILQNILLAAMLSTAITGLLGGMGVFKGTWGSVGGAAAILLGMFVTFEGAKQLNIRDDLDEAVKKFEKLEIDHGDLEGKLDTAIAQIESFKNISTGLEIVVYCRTATHTQRIFLVSEPNPFGDQLEEMPPTLPAVFGSDGKTTREIELFVAGYRPDGYDLPGAARFGGSAVSSRLPTTEPAFTLRIERGEFNADTRKLQNTKVHIRVHEYNALRKCDDPGSL